MSMPVYWVISPEEREGLDTAEYPLAYLGYRLDPLSPAFFCPEIHPEASSLMVLQDNETPQYPPSETLAHCIAQYAATIHSGIFCDFDQPVRAFWGDLLQFLDPVCVAFGLSLFVPQAYADAAPHGYILVRSDLSGGYFPKYAQECAAKYPNRAVLELRPASAEFVLPSPSGVGTSITPALRKQLLETHDASVFFSPDLLCSYFAFWDAKELHMVLYDTQETIQKKLACAEEAGFRAAIGLHQELRCTLSDPDT